MSGPTTALFTTSDPLSVLLAASLIRAQRAIVAAHQEAARQHRQHQQDQQQVLQSLAQAADTAWQGIRQRLQQAEQAAAQLFGLTAGLACLDQIQASRPVPPASDDLPATAAYIRDLELFSEHLRPLLLQQSALRTGDAALADTELDAVAAALPPAGLACRLMQRWPEGLALPQALAAQFAELEQCLPGARADALATELRLAIQAALEAEQQRQLQQAQALILEQSLLDLGYQVEEIAETLFVEGGVVHFRRSGWGDYMVRMRIDTRQSSVNFNVIRAVAEGENQRSVQDHIAEDRWCSEFPALLKALEARGLQLQVTRRLEAGELPVQLVLRDKLPELKDDLQTAAPKLKQHSL